LRFEKAHLIYRRMF